MITRLRTAAGAAAVALAASVALAGGAAAQTAPTIVTSDPSSATITKADASVAEGTFTNRSSADLMCLGIIASADTISQLAKEGVMTMGVFGGDGQPSAALQAKMDADQAAGHVGVFGDFTGGLGGLLPVTKGTTATWSAPLLAPTSGTARTDFRAGVLALCVVADPAATTPKLIVETAYEGQGLLDGGSLGGGTGSLGSLGS